jgi:hypothetical protein
MRQLTPRRRWLATSSLLFAGFILVPMLLVMLLNGGGLNHMLTPVGSYFSLFQLMWPEQPLGALQFILTKSFVVLAHHDPRSDLNLWTVEYDAVTLLVYLGVALLAGRLLSQRLQRAGLAVALTGAALVVATFTYITVLDHCAGPTWVGFVTLYAFGVSGFDISPSWQWMFGAAGLGLLGFGLWRMRGAQTNR